MNDFHPIPAPRWPDSPRVGLDLGSRQVKLTVAGPRGLIQSQLLDSVPFWLALRQRGDLDHAALGLDPAWPLVACGYGKAALPPHWPAISEIRAHWRGALLQTGLADFTLVELGGQDSKVVQVENGRALDFVTNDRCAAGTGRYLENMSRLLTVDLAELARHSADPVEITGTCAIFGESEVLSHLAQGAPLERIMAGINHSVARRVAQMVRRYRPRRIVMCGGVAFNGALVAQVEQLTGCPVIIPPHPQLNGALGCVTEEVSHG